MTITVKIAKIDREINFDVAALPVVSQSYVAWYGLTQCLNDAHASVKASAFKTETEFLAAVEAKVQKRFDQIVSGDVPSTRRDGTATKAKAVALLASMTDEEVLELLATQRAAAAKAAA